MISVTLRFDYPDFTEIDDDNEAYELLSEMSVDDIICRVQEAGKPINMDVEVY